MREKWIIRGLFLIITASVAGLVFLFIGSHTQLEPRVGGQYREGLLGQPRYINPVIAQTNDTDRDLVRLVYSSLFEYDGQGNLVPDLIQDYTISEDGLVYTIEIRKNVLWHDNEPLTIDDIIFTIKTIQDPEYKSPLRVNWQGVETERIDDYTMSLVLKNVYAPFLHNLAVYILPKHLWAGISAANFPLAEYNLKPVGSGPYKFSKLNNDKEGKIESIELVRSQNFYLENPYPLKTDEKIYPPFIEKIVLKFYSSQPSLVQAYQNRKIDGLNLISGLNREDLRNHLNFHEVNLPAYYAVFFNQTKSKALADETVRLALNYATNKQEIIDQVLNGKGEKVDAPLLPGWLGYNEEIKVYDFALEHANNILEAEGWIDDDQDGIREKTEENEDDEEDNEEKILLEINLLTTNWPELKKTAEILKEQWEKIGARVNLTIVEPNSIQQDFLRPRQYEALLFGEVLSADPDPFAFWHSSQKKDPGLNLSLYQNEKIDKLLEEARQTLDQTQRAAKYAEFQKLLIEDAPAVFLYTPLYFYPVSKNVKEISIEKLPQPSYRFSQIENWYLETARIWKKN